LRIGRFVPLGQPYRDPGLAEDGDSRKHRLFGRDDRLDDANLGHGGRGEEVVAAGGKILARFPLAQMVEDSLARGEFFLFAPAEKPPLLCQHDDQHSVRREPTSASWKSLSKLPGFSLSLVKSSE